MRVALIVLSTWLLVCDTFARPCENNRDCGSNECCLQRMEGKKLLKTCQPRARQSQRCTPKPKYHGIPGRQDYFYSHCPCEHEAMVCRFPGTFHSLTSDVETQDYYFYSSLMSPQDVHQVMDKLHGRCLVAAGEKKHASQSFLKYPAQIIEE